MERISRLSDGIVGKAALVFGTLAAACVLALAFALPAQAAVAAPRYVYVGSENLVAGGTVTEGSGTASYDPTTATLTLDNATIATSRYGNAIWLSGDDAATVNIVLNGANVITGGNSNGTAVSSDYSLALSGDGSLSIDSYGSGIQAIDSTDHPTISITSGTYEVNVSSSGITASGAISITGGKVTVAAGSSSRAIASSYAKVSNVASAVKVTSGYLSEGAEFIKSGSTYQVSSIGYVTLLSWGGGTKANLDTVTYGYKYSIRAIGANAFNTAKGKKVKKITLSYHVYTIGKNAFKNTKALTNLNIKDWYSSLLYSDSVSINKKAFSGCGKSSGKKLVVHTGAKSGKYYTTNPKVKKALVKKGLSKNATVKK